MDDADYSTSSVSHPLYLLFTSPPVVERGVAVEDRWVCGAYYSQSGPCDALRSRDEAGEGRSDRIMVVIAYIPVPSLSLCLARAPSLFFGSFNGN